MVRSIAVRLLAGGALGLPALFGATSATAAPCTGVTFGVPYASSYSCNSLGAPAGLGTPFGGITFLDSNTLLIGGNANSALGNIQAVGVTRDGAGHITGFSGPATPYASAPNIDGGLSFGPGGVLFFTGYPINTLGQIKPGSVAPDKVINLNGLTPAVASSVGSLAFVPAGFAGAGGMKLLSYNSDNWYSATLTPDGTGTYDVSVTPGPTLVGGIEGVVYIDGSNAGFGGNDSVLVAEWGVGRVGAYEIDSNGDPIVSTRQDFLLGLSGAEGALIDPLTGDFLFSTFGGGNQVLVISGFTKPEEPPTEVPEPASLLVFLGGLAGLRVVRRRGERPHA